MLGHILAVSSLLFHYINTPTATMREKPSENSTVASEAIFSEPVKVLEESGDWVKIETIIDHYQGWTKKSSILQSETEFLANPSAITATINRCSAHLYGVQDTEYGPLLTLPFESRLEVITPKEESDSRWIQVALPNGQKGYIQRGDVELKPHTLTRAEVCDFSLKFLNLPYTWGGRSSFGYDCSSFVQMLYRQMGIQIPRDSKDQAKWEGFKKIPDEQLVAGDLIFFGHGEDKIRHVGLYLGNDQFIHATVHENMPYIRISKLSSPFWSGSGAYVYRTSRALK